MSWDNLTKVSGIIIYTQTDKKVHSQYYDDLISQSSRQEFEEGMNLKFTKYGQSNAFLYKNTIVVAHVVDSLRFFVFGGTKSNELFFDSVLDTLVLSLGILYGSKPLCSDLIASQRHILLLAIDELIDQGFVLEGDPEVIASRVMIKGDHSYNGAVQGMSPWF